MKKSKKDRLFTAGLILMLLAGLSLLLYPSVSSYLNSVRQAQSILTYDNEVAALRQEDYQRLRQQAEEYNVSLLDRPSPYGLTDAQQTLYPTTLLAGGSDVMAYLEVPSIGVTLPICHGTETSTLQKAVGHLEWSSLPVGGSSTQTTRSLAVFTIDAAMRLRIVLKQQQMMLLADSYHVWRNATFAVQMHGEQGAGLPGDMALDKRIIHLQRIY